MKWGWCQEIQLGPNFWISILEEPHDRKINLNFQEMVKANN